jgi:protease-4
MACDRVVAHPATITGSIGVIMQFLNYKGLFEKHGLRWETFVPEGAQLKDIGAADKEMTPEDREVLQSMVEDMYELFLDRVKAGRKNLTEETIRTLADGRPYTGGQAHEAGLVDVLGSFEEALAEARKIRRFGADPRVVEYKTVTPFSSLFGLSSLREPAGADGVADLAHALESRTVPRLYYLYQQ